MTINEHPLIAEAVALTKPWYQPHPGISRHDQAVAETLTTHIPDAAPHLVAAARVAHSFALAPTEGAVMPLLTLRLGSQTASIVEVMNNENQALSTLHGPALDLYLRLLIQYNTEAVCVSAADKIVVLTKLTDPEYISHTIEEKVISGLQTYYGFFQHHTEPYLPAALSKKLDELMSLIRASYPGSD